MPITLIAIIVISGVIIVSDTGASFLFINGLSMKKNKLTLAILFSVSMPALAQNDTMVVTASGYEQKLTNAPASISVIGQDALTQKNYSDLGEALSGVEGVDVRGGTGKTGGLDISIRGMPSSYTLILIDGIRQSASSDTTPNGFDTLNTAMMPPCQQLIILR